MQYGPLPGTGSRGCQGGAQIGTMQKRRATDVSSARRRLQALEWAVAPTPQLAVANVDASKYAQFRASAIDIPFESISSIAAADPLRRLAAGEMPAIILRNAMAPADCRALMNGINTAGRFPPAFLPFLDLDTEMGSAEG
eukprot:SAG11_NODE_965_length_6360_cov_11.622584_2_plen_140_part_00